MAFPPPYGIDYEIKSADRGLIKGVKASHLKMCSFQLWRHRFLGLSSPSLSKIRVPRLNIQKETHAVSLSGTIRRPDLNLVSKSYKKPRRLQSGEKNKSIKCSVSNWGGAVTQNCTYSSSDVELEQCTSLICQPDDSLKVLLCAVFKILNHPSM